MAYKWGLLLTKWDNPPRRSLVFFFHFVNLTGKTFKSLKLEKKGKFKEIWSPVSKFSSLVGIPLKFNMDPEK